MIRSATARVKGVVRPASTEAPPPRRIPFAFRADPVALDGLGLDPTARAAFVLILDNAKDRGWRCRLSNGTIGRILGRCPMTISRALGRLESAGLVRRELIAGGRIRLAIAVTWEGVADPRLTEQAALRRERLRGSAQAQEGLGAGVEQTISPTQGEIPNAARSSLGMEGEDAASRVASGPEAAAYLRACIAAGRRGEPMPPPPGVPMAQVPLSPEGIRIPYTLAPPKGVRETDTLLKGGHNGPTLTPNVSRIRENLPKAPVVPAMNATVEVGRMVKGLADALRSEDVGRRRVGPAKLARQLAELRRRHAKRDRWPIASTSTTPASIRSSGMMSG